MLTEEEVKALQTELESSKTELEAARTEIQGVKDIYAAKETAYTKLEQSVTAKDEEISTLKQTVSTGEADKATMALAIKSETQSFSERRIKELTDSFNDAVSAYKGVVAAANPAVPVHLITGDTIEAVDAALVSASALVTQVRTTIEAEIAAGKVPAGAPPRTAPDLSALTAREKIAHAVANKS